MPNLRSLRFWLTLSAAATFTIGAIRAAAAPSLTTEAAQIPSSQSSVLIIAITAFLLVVAALFLVSPKMKGSKTAPRFAKLAKKSAQKRSRRK